MTNLSRLQQLLVELGFDGIIIPSSDEYLSEFAPSSDQRLRWVTGFSGSTGLAIVLRDRAALFLDGRYKSQGIVEVAGTGIEVLNAGIPNWQSWLAKNVKAGEKLIIDTRLHSYTETEALFLFADRIHVVLSEVANNPVDSLWIVNRPSPSKSTIVDYLTKFSGFSSEEKLARLCQRLRDRQIDWHMIADPEDVAWILNVRIVEDLCALDANGWPTLPVCLSRAIVGANGKLYWFVESSRLSADLARRLSSNVELRNPDEFEQFITEFLLERSVSANFRKTPYRYASPLRDGNMLFNDDCVSHWRWAKHQNEIDGAKQAHYHDGKAVIRFLAWLENTLPVRSISEMEAADRLVAFRSELPEYLGPSMSLMSASGPSGSMPHYVPSKSSNRILNNHPIYWMDSGGQFLGGSTDNTVCVALGEPDARHIRAHTLIVKGFIALTRAKFPEGISSTQLDSFARQFLWDEGMDFRHGTGHGVGNFMNIHEGPYIRKEIDHPLVAPMGAGMIVSNEPAYYAEGDFGVRIESHMVAVPSKYPGFLEFETLSRLPIDPRLIDKNMLSRGELQWLLEYHAQIAQTYLGCFDEETTNWLESIIRSYEAMMASIWTQ